jgi:hypothetical protein
MTKPGGESIPLDGQRWLHAPTGAWWHEVRFHRGRVVIALEGRVGHTTRMTRPEDDRGTGAAILGPPVWLREAKDCLDCPPGPPAGEPEKCPASPLACGHHCGHAWTHDTCCYCKKEWGETGVA